MQNNFSQLEISSPHGGHFECHDSKHMRKQFCETYIEHSLQVIIRNDPVTYKGRFIKNIFS